VHDAGAGVHVSKVSAYLPACQASRTEAANYQP
jgi:hypothetical protein